LFEKYIIGAIYEKDCTTPKESHQHRVGRTGTLALLEKGCSMWFVYDEPKDKALQTSRVEKFNEDDNRVWVYTENSVYRLDKI
jgi:superfamily II DNA/RNA helicase